MLHDAPDNGPARAMPFSPYFHAARIGLAALIGGELMTYIEAIEYIAGQDDLPVVKFLIEATAAVYSTPIAYIRTDVDVARRKRGKPLLMDIVQ